MTASAVLVLNCGSSSVKFALVDPPSGRRLLSGLAERVGTPEVTLEIDTGVDTGTDTDVDTDVAAEVDAGKPRTSTPQDGSVHGILVEFLAAVGRVQDVQVGAVGHRVVARRRALRPTPWSSTTRCSTRDRRPAPTWRRCTTRPTCRASRPSRAVLPGACRRWRCSTPPSTRRCRARAYRYAVPYAAVRRPPRPPLRLPRHQPPLRQRAAAAELLGRPLEELQLVDRCTWATAAAPRAVRGGARSTPRWA